jgi:hypothetical protein
MANGRAAIAAQVASWRTCHGSPLIRESRSRHEQIDECAEWANKMVALASYARQ